MATPFVTLLGLLAGLAVPKVSSHVALTYPPARSYNLDFLDNARTPGPCGMPKGNTYHDFIFE